MIKTTDDLITSIKNGASIPTNESRFTVTRLLEMCDDYVHGELVQSVLNTNAELLLTTEDVVCDGSTSYVIPYRAVGRVLRYIHYYSDANSTPTEPKCLQANQTKETGIRFVGDKFFPNPSPTTGFYQLCYALRPSKLIPVSSAGIVTGVNMLAGSVSLSRIPTGVVVGSLVDFIRVKQGCDILGFDCLVTNIDDLTVTFSSLPTISVGDYCAAAETSPVLPFPLELAPLVSKAVVCKVLEAQGDIEMLAAAKDELNSLKKTCFSILTPRISTQSPCLNPSPFMSRRRR
jgi:hypothetical protein